MSLAINLVDFATSVATNSKQLKTLINGNAADLAGLSTTAKTNLVAAINEVSAAVAGAGASINDVGTSTLSVWSSSKTDGAINAATAALVATAPGTLDTLNELAAALADDPNFATTMTTALAAKAPLASPAFTGTPTGITKAHVGLANVDNTTDALKPVSTATATALTGKEPTITGGSAGQYLKGDKTLGTMDKTAVGLVNVDNTTDALKPVSTATTTALGLKANAANPAFTGTPTGLTAAHVGLANVDNTTDANKPVSTAQATAIGLKANINSPALVTPNVGVATATTLNKITVTPPATSATLTIVQGATLTASANATVSGTNTGDQSLAGLAPLANPTFTGTVNGITKAMVGLPNVDNTADSAKPVSTAQATAIALSATNLAVGDTATDFVTVFNAGLV